MKCHTSVAVASGSRRGARPRGKEDVVVSAVRDRRRSTMRRIRVPVVVASVSACLALAVALLGPLAAPPAASAQGNVTMEWLGQMFFRFTSPNGVVVMTSPWLTGQDSPITLDDVD